MRRRTLLGALGALAASGVAGCRRKEPLPALGSIGEFALTDQNGRGFGSKELRGRPWIAAFFFTRCPTVCPRITRRMREVQLALGARHAAVRMVSLSVDPDNDTPAVLARYARDHQADLSSWSFRTGDHAVVQRTAVEGAKLALEGRADAAAEDFGILHGSHLVLVDGALAIRGYYRTSDDAEMTRLVEDAVGLGR